MSKERLEEIINRKPSRWGNLTIKEFERDIKMLQEQAERVQELEEENKQIKDAYSDRESDIDSYQNMLGIGFEDMAMEMPIERIQGEKINMLEQQNKRYRKAINSINVKASLFGANEQVDEAILEAIRLLEESE